MPNRESKEQQGNKFELVRRLKEQGLAPGDVAIQAGTAKSTVCIYFRAIDLGLSSLHQYYDYLAREKGYLSRQDYLNALAERRGDGSEYECIRRRVIRRQRNPENIALSRLVQKGLQANGETEAWLGRQIGVSTQMVSAYACGKAMPGEDKRERLYRVLKRQ